MTKNIIYILALLLAITTSCKHADKAVEAPKPAVYYWRTTLTLDSVERQFLQDHNVGKMYVRYFDVTLDENKQLQPNATITFQDSIPSGIEVIPTVFIVNNCLEHGIDSIASLLVKRVLQMNETHDIAGVSELQIDCDWTIKTQNAYFKFLEQVKQLLQEHNMKLSATIRLHQLAMEAPPVDYGVLMMYNTGDLKNSKQRNPILDMRDVEPFLKYVENYSMGSEYEGIDNTTSILDSKYKKFDKAYKYAYDMTEKEIHQAVEGLYHNLSKFGRLNRNIKNIAI